MIFDEPNFSNVKFTLFGTLSIIISNLVNRKAFVKVNYIRNRRPYIVKRN